MVPALYAGDMFHAAKDALTSRTALHFINQQIERYGELVDLKINSRNKTLEVSCLLHGETQPIHVTVGDYVVESTPEGRFVRVTQFRCNRPWLQNLLTDLLQDRRFAVPGWAAHIL